MDKNLKIAGIVGLIGLAAAGGTALIIADQRRRRTQELLRGFVQRVWEYEVRFRRAAGGGGRLDSSQYARIAVQDPDAAIRQICADVYQGITWVSDRETHGESEYWQTPEETVTTKRGDCEDKALVARDLLESIGFYKIRVIVGAWAGKGHAWLESEDGKFFMDPTAGTIAFGRPQDYEPALWLGGGSPLVNTAVTPTLAMATA